MNRKLRKLKRDPKLFFKDMYTKHYMRVKKHLPIKYNGHYQYTVVSAVYNVSKYLEEYFNSLVNQTLNFKKHIHLILVDDGSTDNSAAIIKKWQAKYPNNITYLYKENGGIASARNLGLKHVTTEWVTFIDSDDFVHPDYFKVVDDQLFKDQSVKFAAGNLRFYFEDNKLVKDTHSLRYRFEKQDVNIVPISNLDNNINLFVTVSFFKTDILHNNGIVFDEKIKPNFEDGKFLADYFLYTESGNAVYLKKAYFFYRKRGDGSSTIDGAWQKKEKFNDVLAYGYLPMLTAYKEKYGYIPKNIQWTVIYEISWHLKTVLNNSRKTRFLSLEEKKIYWQLCREIFSLIDEKLILDFNLIGIWFLYKVGMLGAFKGINPPFNITYIENIDREKKQILLVYPTYFDIASSFKINGKDIFPLYIKKTNHNFADEMFVQEIRVWLPYQNESDLLTISLNGQESRLSLFGKQTQHIKVADISQAYMPSEKYKTDGSWLLMDRDIQADDNAEHFYRYMKNNHPEQKCYFALNKNSHDWNRLYAEGFNLLDYGSEEFDFRLRRASKIISSHFDDYISNHFGDEYEHSKKFVFLQHGVIQNNLSHYMNRKRNFLCFVTTTPDEYHSIADDYTSYRSGKKETVLTGLARHDALLNGNSYDEKVILIMPTWRSGILGKPTGTGNAREINPNFMETSYAQYWGSFIRSTYLKTLAEQYGYQIIFAPHANIEPYLPLFNVPDYISVWGAATSKESIQQLFQKARLMISDYSSVTSEMGFLNKTVLYYQFDKEEVFSGSHIVQQGYFSFEEHGFGPIAYDEETLLNNLENSLKNEGMPIEPYKTRIQETFPFRDGKNCERIYRAVMNLDRPDNLDFQTAYEYYLHAVKTEDLQNVQNRAEYLMNCEDFHADNRASSIMLNYADTLFRLGNIAKLASFVATEQLPLESRAYWNALTNVALHRYKEAETYFAKHPQSDIKSLILHLQCVANLSKHSDFTQISKQISVLNPTAGDNAMVEILHGICKKNNIIAFSNAEKLLPVFTQSQRQFYKPELIAANLASILGQYGLAWNFIKKYQSHSGNSGAAELATAYLDYSKAKYENCIQHMEHLFPYPIGIISAQYCSFYIESLLRVGDISRAEKLLQQAKTHYSADSLKSVEIKLFILKQNLKKMFEHI